MWARMNAESNNSNTLKIYKELTYIQTSDGELYATPTERATVERLANQNKFLNLWSETINTSIIKRIFSKEVDDIDNALLMISDKNLRARVQKEVDERRKSWTRLNINERIMTHEQIIKIESEPLFKLFLRRIWFKSTQEYYDLFGEDWEKRETAVNRFKGN